MAFAGLKEAFSFRNCDEFGGNPLAMGLSG
jgi:hypothetical protein